MMDLVRIQALANHLRTIPREAFNMDMFLKSNTTIQDLNECRSCGCIAGWAVALFDPDFNLQTSQLTIADKARRLLKLDTVEAQELFLPDESTAYSATPTRAANVLDYCVKHDGLIDWSPFIQSGGGT